MSNYFALWSIVFMIGFVVMFDAVHCRNRLIRVPGSISLLSPDEVDRIHAIWSACEEA